MELVPFDEYLANLRGLQVCNYSSSKSFPTILAPQSHCCMTQTDTFRMLVGALTFTIHDMISSAEGEVWRLCFSW